MTRKPLLERLAAEPTHSPTPSTTTEPMHEVRHDRGDALSRPIAAMIFEGVAARLHGPGDGLRYTGRDGKPIEEYRDATELAAIAKQLPGKPVTMGHPRGTEDNANGILSQGAKGNVVGVVLDARVDGDQVVVRLLVEQVANAKAILGGAGHELSLGYLRVLDDANYQRDIRVDHLSTVPRGNCGNRCAVKLDCADTPSQPCACGEASSMETLRSELARLDESIATLEPDHPMARNFARDFLVARRDALLAVPGIRDRAPKRFDSEATATKKMRERVATRSAT